MFRFLLLATYFLGNFASASDCSNLIGTCEYYACISQAYSCNEQEYPKAFGYHYCKIFDERAQFFSVRGQFFLSQIKVCLQQEIEASQRISCQQLKTLAPLHHRICYAKFDFCSLPHADQVLIATTVFDTFIKDPEFQKSAWSILTCRNPRP